MSLETFQGLVREFGGRIGVPDVEADAEGYVALTFDDLVLHLQHDGDEDEAVVFTRLGEVDDLRAEQVYAWLLGANLFWQGAKGATFSVEPATGAVFLSDRKAMAVLRLEAFVPWLERFLDVAGHWRGRLAAANAGGPLDDDPSGPGGGGDGGPSPSGGDEGGSRRPGEHFVIRA